MTSSDGESFYGPRAGFDYEALSGILGSVSIACWVFVFSPQIVENFRRHSAEGLSIVFIVIWLLGDLFNILGAILQGVLPTMIILAVYYTLADIILLLQCFYYRGFTLSDSPPQLPASSSGSILDGTEQDRDHSSRMPNGHAAAIEEEEDDEDTPLLSRTDSPIRRTAPQLPVPTPADADRTERRGSMSSLMSALSAVDGTHLNPAVPLVNVDRDVASPAPVKKRRFALLWSTLFNIASLLVVCLAGAFGWWLSTRAARSPYKRHGGAKDYDTPDARFHRHGDPRETLPLDVGGQVFGYLCAVLYLGSRVPQLMLNYRRKSTEGISMLFFLFACVGNLTYVLSIFAYEPPCARWVTAIDPDTRWPIGYSDGCTEGEWHAQYSRYILVNVSWLIGSAGTLLLDAAVFVQFYMYRGRSPNEGAIRIDSMPSSPLDERRQAEEDRSR